jgi:DNA ligase 1
MLLLPKGKVANGHINTGWTMSEKFDGFRAWWDGGISRDHNVVPWMRKRDTVRKEPLPCTGLWSGNGNPIYAPDWWLDQLPNEILDGELWCGYGMFQKVASIAKRLPDNMGDWTQIQYCVFDTPTCDEIFMTRAISTPTCKMTIIRDKCIAFFAENDGQWTSGTRQHIKGLEMLHEMQFPEFVKPVSIQRARNVADFVAEIMHQGGEGAIVRDPTQFWLPDRNKFILKVKPKQDSEGIVAGFVPGKGKHKGKLGSVLVNWNGVQFAISGFTDRERELVDGKPVTLPDIGESISFQYRDLSSNGVPKEANYYRGRES